MVEVTGPFGQALSALGAGATSLALLVLLHAALVRWAEAAHGPQRAAVSAPSIALFASRPIP